jgi:NAD(P)-dependent dehydrogenase (short-subunit alcohol dehydrogenase family)
MEMRLTNKIVVVTGASKGIGLAATRSFIDEGAKVVAVSRKSGAALEELAGPALRHVSVDLMNPEAPGQAIAAAVETFGGVDVLVNCAGGPPPGVVLPRGSFLDAGDADWRVVFEFNLLAVVRAIRATIPVMLERGGGSIVNVSSTNARQPSPINVDYGVAKAGLTNLGKALSEEFGPRGIRVNTVSPGPVRTPWWTDEGGVADMIAAQAGADREVVMSTMVPEMMGLTTGRMADAQEVADQIVLLASPRSASTTGADVVVDSGMLKAT